MDSGEKIRTLLSSDEISAAVERLAGEIARDYEDKNPLLVGILKGSFIFLADLSRRLDFPLEVDFLRVSSYGMSSESSGETRILHSLHAGIENRDVLVVEDVIDTGLTTSCIMDYLRGMSPASLKLCALMDKPERRNVSVTPDYLGFTVPNEFLVGYGLDFAEKYRNLPEICVLETCENEQ
jgi:hypoxanthine phosphoribosyltransferase